MFSLDIMQAGAPAVEFGWLGRGYLFVLLAGVPVLAVLQRIDDADLPPRKSLYVSGIIGIAALVILAAIPLVVERVELAAIGFQPVAFTTFIMWTVGVTAAALLGNFIITRSAAALGVRESRLTFHLLPRAGDERAAFVALAATAGLGEELLYHGYAMAGLTAWLGNAWWAALVANTAFGVLHGYQGYIGIMRAGLMGLVLTLPVIMGAGLWPSIAGHFLIDVLLGFGAWRLLIPADQIPQELSNQ